MNTISRIWLFLCLFVIFDDLYATDFNLNELPTRKEVEPIGSFSSKNLNRDLINHFIKSDELILQNRDSVINLVKQLNKVGTTERDKAHFKDALQIHFQALQISKQVNDTFGQIIALNNLGTDLRRTTAYTEASEYHFNALELSNTSDNYLKSRAVALNGLGNIFLSLDKLDESKEYFLRAIEIEAKAKSDLGKAINFANIGGVFIRKKQLDSALYYYHKSLEANKIIKSSLGIDLCNSAIGSIYIKQGRDDIGLELLRNAVNSIENTKDVFHIIEIKITYCESLIELNQLDEAEKVLHEVIQLAASIHSPEHQQTAYDLLTTVLKKQGRYSEALEAKEFARIYNDSSNTISNEVKVIELENRYKISEASQRIKGTSKN